MSGRHRSRQPRRRDLETPSARSRSRRRCSPEPLSGAYKVSRPRDEIQVRSFTPPCDIASSSKHDGSESNHTLSKVFLKGIEQILSSKNVNQGVINNNIIAEFNPLLHDIMEWLNAVDEYAQINNWSDQVTCHLALSKLRGLAETWYRGLPTRLFTWGEWKQLLLENFIPKRDLHSDMSIMLNYTPQPQQSLYAYCFEKLALINKMKIPLSDADKVNLIMGGIENKQIRFSVETSQITNPAKLAGYFKVFSDTNNYNEPKTESAKPGTSYNGIMAPIIAKKK